MRKLFIENFCSRASADSFAFHGKNGKESETEYNEGNVRRNYIKIDLVEPHLSSIVLRNKIQVIYKITLNILF